MNIIRGTEKKQPKIEREGAKLCFIVFFFQFENIINIIVK